MSNLTTFLQGLKKTDVPTHPTLPAVPLPAGAIVKGRPECRGCQIYALNTTLKHQSFCSMSVDGPIDEDHRINTDDLRTFEAILRLLYRLEFPFYGLQAGFLINGSGSPNFIDGVQWEIVDAYDETVESVTFSYIRIKPGGGDARRLPIITGAPERMGVIQPGDYFHFVWPCVLYGKRQPRILQVLYQENGEYICWINQSVTNYGYSQDSANPNPPKFYCTSYREAGDPERWIEIVDLEPSPLFTKRRKVTFSGANIPEDGRFVLKVKGGIDGALGEPTESRFVVRKLVAGEWVDISIDARSNSRYFSNRTGAGEDGYGAHKTTICLGTSDINENVLESVIADASKVEFTYWGQVPRGTRGACLQDVLRCKHCKLDTTNSVLGDPRAEKVDPAGRTWRCAKAFVYNELEEDYFPNEGVTREEFGVNCYLRGTCSQFEQMHEEDYFTVKNDLARFLAQMQYAQPLRVVQNAIGSSSHLNQTVARVLHASLIMLYWMRDIGNGSGNFQKAFFPETDGGYHGEVTIVTDEDGNEDFSYTRGAFEDTGHEWEDTVFDDLESFPGPGAIPNMVPNFTERDSPYQEPHDTETDPFQIEVKHTFRGQPRIERGTGSLRGRWANRYGKLLAAEDLICPKITLDLMNEWQERGFVKVIIHDPPLIVDGTEYDFELRVLPLIQSEKSIQTVVSGVIAAAEIIDGKLRLEIENQPHYYGFDIPGGGRSIVTWLAGGSFVRAPDWYKPQFPEETDYSIGADTDLCRCGDALSFPGIPALSEVILNVLHAKPHAGAAGSWGNVTEEALGYVTGFWEPIGQGESRVPPVFTYVIRNSDLAEFTRLTDTTRPATIATEEYWVDPITGWFYWSELDKGDICAVGGIFQPEFIEWEATVTLGRNTTGVYTSNDAAFDTGFASLAGATIVTLDGNPIVYTAGAPVPLTSYTTTTDSAGKVVVLFHMDDSGHRFRVVIPTETAANSPGDVAPCPGYGTGVEYGRKQDVVHSIGSADEMELITANLGALAGESVVCKRNQQVAHGDIDFQATEYATDAYGTTSTSDYIWLPGFGRLLQKKSKTDALRATGNSWCFLLGQIRRWDHRAMPSARHLNDFIDALDRTNRLHQTLPAAAGPPLIGFRLYQEHVYLDESQFTGTCPTGAFRLNINETPLGPGLPYSLAHRAFQEAHDRRFDDAVRVATTGNHEFVTDYGYIDRSTVTADDYTAAGCPDVPVSFTEYGGPVSGVGVPLPGGSINHMGYYTANAYLEASLANRITGVNWISNGYAGVEGCPGSGTYFFQYTDGSSGTTSQPGWECGVIGNGLMTSHPRTLLPSEPHLGNYIGGVHSIDFLGDGHAAPGAVCHISSATGGGFAFSQFMQAAGNGLTIVNAKIRVRVNGFSAHNITTSQAGYASPVVRNDDVTTECSLILIAGYMADVNTGAFQWDILATGLGGDMEAGKWRCLDLTAIMQGIVDVHGNSRYSRWALVPAPSGEALETTNPAGLLLSHATTFTYGTHVDPLHDPGVPYYIEGEGWYIASSHCKYVTWTDVQIDGIDLEFGGAPRGGHFWIGNQSPMA